MDTMNYSKVKMTDGTAYILSNAKMSRNGMKKNHIEKTGVNNVQYIVNICNGRAYKII